MCSLSLTLSMCAVTHYICPSASGGGVPEMKVGGFFVGKKCTSVL